ncbi:hypothetical protein OEZ85_000558 [Tetradesmus obliquus]|uniref:Uncharacterized protein n=1 Tax=Tetradesmus obliquus TaxID=3088 RepID=A0ABY8UM51_TETOB|nr:hypothetical protein OEZ85_000558 [Tetradesmus obliquus]
MASFAKTAALLLCVCLVLSASSADAASIRGRELQATIANCRSHRTIAGGRQVCTACTTGATKPHLSASKTLRHTGE